MYVIIDYYHVHRCRGLTVVLVDGPGIPQGPECGRRRWGTNSGEVYSRIALADAQQSYDQVIDRFPV